MKTFLLLAAIVALLGARLPEDPVEAVSRALALGAAAERRGDGKAMLKAARELEALGARPQSEADNLSGRWRELAAAAGVEDKAPPFRGRALGPAYRAGVLQARASLSTEQVFLAGQPAVIALVPEPTRQLGMTIVAADKTSICSRTATPRRARCSWFPVFTSRVQIRIVNDSATPARYYLVSN